MQDHMQAYDLDRFSTQEFNTLRVVANRTAAQEKRRRSLKVVERIVTCALVLALMVSVLYSQTRMTAMSDEIASLEAQLVEERSVYDQLAYRLESDATLNKIEAYVSGQLGMVKTDKSQVTYIALAEDNCVEKAEGGLAKYWETLQQKVDELLVYVRG